MNTSFTSGPWVATNSHTIESKGKKAIRIATLCLSGRPSGQPWKIESFLPEAEANARLIAAAPDLVYALQNILDIPEPFVMSERELEMRTLARVALKQAIQQ